MKAAAVLVGCLVTLASTTAPPQEKGIIEWIASIIRTTTELPPITFPPQDPPEDCPPCQCGIARTRRRIVGGVETNVLQFPWMALLMYNGRFYCGGSLISDFHVLTAAHCTSGFRRDRMTVRFLEHDRFVANETETMVRNVSAIIRHLRYNPSTYDNDIALLKLDKRVDLSKAVKRSRADDNGEPDEDGNLPGLRPVCLPSAGHTYTNCKGVVTGWGTTEEGGSVSDRLQEVTVPIISNADCRKTAYGNRITDNMICAGEAEGGRDACQGDSGGPMHCLNSTTAAYQEVGVVSWGEGCARPDRPGVYSRVNRYLTWIKSNTRDACYCS